GSAQDESNWRAILDHFDKAVQIGLTATPLRTDNVETYAYFDNAISTYSLRQGITDGFLAPYRVRRVVMASTEAEGDGEATAPGEVAGQPVEDVPIDAESAERVESAADLMTWTEDIAK